MMNSCDEQINIQENWSWREKENKGTHAYKQLNSLMEN